MKSRFLPILFLLTLGSAQAITQTISREGVVYADLETFARDISAGMAVGSASPKVWRLAAVGKDMVLVQDSNLAQLNGQRYQMAGKTLLENGKGYAPLDSLRALFGVNVATQNAGSGSSSASAAHTSSSTSATELSSEPVEGAPVEQPNYSRDAILAAVNKVRAQGRKCGDTFYPAVGPLRWSRLLEQSALKHSKNMADKQFFEHTDPQGRTPQDRILGGGYVGSATGENIAAYYTDNPDKVLEAWVKSPGHCANLMYSDYTEFGLGVYFLPYDKSKKYLRLWTQNFGG